MPRYRLVPLFLLASLTACSNVNLSALGVHRIDVQQGNALDQENVAKLKPGLSRSQVRFLLGTPLVVDPFRNDRWDYVYTLYKAGKLADQKRITLFFSGDTLERIEGDVVAGEPVAAATEAARPSAENVDAAKPAAEPSAAAPQSAAETLPLESSPKPVSQAEPSELVAAAADTPTPAADSAAAAPLTSVVPPLPSPKGAPAYTDPHPPAETSLQTDADVAQIKPDVMPVFPDADAEAQAAEAALDPAASAVLQAVKAWAMAWANRSDDAYIAAYAPEFVPAGGGTRADWEKRRRLLLGLARNIDLRVESPKLEMAADGSALVTLNQYYSSDNFKDAVVKQLKLVQHDGQWLITDERVLSVLRPKKK